MKNRVKCLQNRAEVVEKKKESGRRTVWTCAEFLDLRRLTAVARRDDLPVRLVWLALLCVDYVATFRADNWGCDGRHTDARPSQPAETCIFHHFHRFSSFFRAGTFIQHIPEINIKHQHKSIKSIKSRSKYV
jgi:hypothetical protein